MSYARAAKDIAVYTGVQVSAKTQQRLVQRQPWAALEPEQPETIYELSLDGGNVKLNSGAKDEPDWRQYKAVRLNAQGECRAWFQDNETLIKTMNARDMEDIVVCLGDGHDGIWNLHEAVVPDPEQRFEILAWYHLKEHLYRLSGDEVDREQLEALLWQGHVQAALVELAPCTSAAAECFRNYLLKHQQRIPNDGY